MIERHSSRGHRLGSAILGLLLAAACAENEATRPQIEPPPACGRLVVVTTDFQSGSIAIADADSSFRVVRDLTAIHSDAVARSFGDKTYVVNRFGGDNIQVLDSRAGFTTLRQFSVGEGSNPQDIVVLSEDRAYVSRLNAATLLEVDPSTGGTRGEVSLAGLADPDGTPDMAGLAFEEPYLYVAVQRLDYGGGTFLPVPPSMLAVVDTRTNELVDVDGAAAGVQGIVLAGLNPIALHREEATGAWLVACAGAFGALDGGIERVDLAGRRSLGWVVREADLGGDMIEFASLEEDRACATVSNALGETSLLAFDRNTGAVVDTLHASSGYHLSDVVATPCGLVVVCDRNPTAPGLRVFDGETGDPVAGITQPISTGLPPFDLEWIETAAP
jgi:hypothetical protein